MDSTDAPNNIVNANGNRCTLKRGDSVRYTDLPNQPVAVIVYDNTDNPTKFRVAYNNQGSQLFTTTQLGGLNIGAIYLIDPSKTSSYEVFISIPISEEQNVSLDVYLISAYFPVNEPGIQEVNLNEEKKPMQLNGYAKVHYHAWTEHNEMTIKAADAERPLIGVLIQGDETTIVGLNVSKEQEKTLKELVKTGSEIEEGNLKFLTTEKNLEKRDYTAVLSQMIYSPVASASSKSIGDISFSDNAQKSK